MVEVIVEVKDKAKVSELKKLGAITHISRFINTIIMEVAQPQMEKLKSNPNVLSVREGKIGRYQV